MKKVLYRTFKPLFFSAKLQEWGFELNLYDWCIINKIINSKQCTILWYVNNVKISYIDDTVIKKIIGKFNQVYRKKPSLTINREKIYNYLGMKLDYSTKEKISIYIKNYIEQYSINYLMICVALPPHQQLNIYSR